MRNFFYILALSMLIIQCDKDQEYRIPHVAVNELLYLNNPIYNSLQVPGGTYIIPHAGVGGILVYRNANNSFNAYDLACPHLDFSDCSIMELDEAKTKAICPCDQSSFLIETGAPLTSGKSPYGMKPYHCSYNMGSNELLISN